MYLLQKSVNWGIQETVKKRGFRGIERSGKFLCAQNIVYGHVLYEIHTFRRPCEYSYTGFSFIVRINNPNAEAFEFESHEDEDFAGGPKPAPWPTQPQWVQNLQWLRKNWTARYVADHNSPSMNRRSRI